MVLHTKQDTPLMPEKLFWNFSWSPALQGLVNQAGSLIEKHNIRIDFALRWFANKEYNSSGICQAAILRLEQDAASISKAEWNRLLKKYVSFLPLRERMGISVTNEIREKAQGIGAVIKEKAHPALLESSRFVSKGRYKGKINMIVIITIALLYFCSALLH